MNESNKSDDESQALKNISVDPEDFSFSASLDKKVDENKETEILLTNVSTP